MNEEKLAVLERLYEEASPGEWRPCGASDGYCQCGQLWSIGTDSHILTAHDEVYDLMPVLVKRGRKKGDEEIRMERMEWGRNGKEERHANLMLIAAMHAALPEMLAYIRKLERSVEGQREAIQALLGDGA